MKIILNKDNIYLLVFLVLITVFLYYNNPKLEQQNKINTNTDEQRYSILRENIEKDTEIKAKAISIFNITTNTKLYGHNDTVIFPIASLTKIMSAMIAKNTIKNEEIIISRDALNQTGDNKLFLNEKWNRDELLKFSLVLSSNDGMFAITKEDKFFILEMNKKAKKIGMKYSMFYNTTGLDIDSNKAGAYSTAEDINTLAIFAMNVHKDIFDVTRLDNAMFLSNDKYEHTIKNTNIMINQIPNILFSKTGNTTLAGGNMVVIFQNSKAEKIAITILGSSVEGRFVDMMKLINLLL
ncbi:MAG: hypothetical protein M3P22_02190 [bacterium]|nr:hypothetical protein [bacterium]